MSWKRLIRFVDDDGKETFGDPCIANENELGELLGQNNLYTVEYAGDSPVACLRMGPVVHVKALLNVITPADVPIIRCVGFNYMQHSPFALLLPLLTETEYWPLTRVPPVA
jgi:hypothetical protein